jgi:preprotein translocase subunit SecE
MKKVTWPTVEELKESTTVVIVSCLMLAAFTYVIDMLITQIFKGIF